MFNEAIFHSKRFVLTRFVRAIDSGDPDPEKPDIDSRGWADSEHASIVGCMEGETITVRIERLKIDVGAALFVTSSDTGVITIESPDDGALPAGDQEIQIKGVKGGNPKKARVEVRFESTSGPIIHELLVHVYKKLTVDVTPHFITIDSATASGTAPVADLDSIMTLVRAIWKPAGVEINVGARRTKTVTFATADIASDDPFPGEIGTLLRTKWPDNSANRVDDTINAYFIKQIGTGNTLGYGFSRASAKQFGMPNPGIILGDQAAGTPRGAVVHWANDLAHEIGHFFQLWHVGQKEQPDEREDSFSNRNLMHVFNGMPNKTTWPAISRPARVAREQARFDDYGYGMLPDGFSCRGCQVTIKELKDRKNDGQTKIARKTIDSSKGPY